MCSTRCTRGRQDHEEVVTNIPCYLPGTRYLVPVSVILLLRVPILIPKRTDKYFPTRQPLRNRILKLITPRAYQFGIGIIIAGMKSYMELNIAKLTHLAASIPVVMGCHQLCKFESRGLWTGLYSKESNLASPHQSPG